VPDAGGFGCRHETVDSFHALTPQVTLLMSVTANVRVVESSRDRADVVSTASTARTTT